jgi:hypothetical protein
MSSPARRECADICCRNADAMEVGRHRMAQDVCNILGLDRNAPVTPI